MAGRVDRLLYRISGRLPCRIIESEPGAPYLERYFIARLFGWTVYLHRFVASDPRGTGLHDHPWRLAISLVLSGGYWELRHAGFNLDGPIAETRSVRPGRLNIIHGTTFHRVVLGEGCTAWSIFAHGPYAKGWGFLRSVTEAGAGLVRFRPAAEVTETSHGKAWWLKGPKGVHHPLRCSLEGLPPGRLS